jgi:hypothetical protein
VADRAGRPSPGERTSAPTRELAQRQSGSDEVLLLWHPESDQVELAVRNLTTGSGCQIEVASADAMDAFNHPFAYVGRCERSDRVSREETTIVNG